jgi:hypothetical protein
VRRLFERVLWHSAYLIWQLPFIDTPSRPAQEPTRPPVQCVPKALIPRVKRPGRGADQSPPSSAKVKNAWSYASTPPYVFVVWCFVKPKDILILPLPYRYKYTAAKLLTMQTLLSFHYRVKSVCIVMRHILYILRHSLYSEVRADVQNR